MIDRTYDYRVTYVDEDGILAETGFNRYVDSGRDYGAVDEDSVDQYAKDLVAELGGQLVEVTEIYSDSESKTLEYHFVETREFGTLRQAVQLNYEFGNDSEARLRVTRQDDGLLDVTFSVEGDTYVNDCSCEDCKRFKEHSSSTVVVEFEDAIEWFETELKSALEWFLEQEDVVPRFSRELFWQYPELANKSDLLDAMSKFAPVATLDSDAESLHFLPSTKGPQVALVNPSGEKLHVRIEDVPDSSQVAIVYGDYGTALMLRRGNYEYGSVIGGVNDAVSDNLRKTIVERAAVLGFRPVAREKVANVDGDYTMTYVNSRGKEVTKMLVNGVRGYGVHVGDLESARAYAEAATSTWNARLIDVKELGLGASLSDLSQDAISK